MDELTLDLTTPEIVVVTMLASLGEAVMAGDQDGIDTLANLLMMEPKFFDVGQKALDKLHAAVKVTHSILTTPTVSS